MPVQRRLAGKHTIVTGAGSGIGRAAAARFADEGATVLCADIDGVAAEATADAIRAQGGEAASLAMDVTSEADAERMAAAALTRRGRIDVLYANAGIAGAGTAATVDLATWRRVLDVNLTGVWLCARAVLPAMRAQRGGAILLQASSAALVGLPSTAAYAAAKGGVLALARQMTADFAREGIRVNAICPSTVPTPLLDAMASAREGETGIGRQDGLARLRARHPLGRLGTVDDVAALAAFLASDEAAWVSGAAGVVDGGYTAV